MKTQLFTLAAMLLLTAACSKKEEATHADANEWPQLDSFHMIMAEAFHPFKDSANLQPAKALAGEMATEAETWAAAELPEKVNTEHVKGLLAQLKSDTRNFADKIAAGAADEEISSDLTALHDSFHSIMEAWHKGPGGGHQHQH
ncbi:MAG: hypothetical protein KF775_18250 [Cyclobacteriaceae bacterium]|nr:hypothetical protein [Cyclobacteriaceae bacterium]